MKTKLRCRWDAEEARLCSERVRELTVSTTLAGESCGTTACGLHSPKRSAGAARHTSTGRSLKKKRGKKKEKESRARSCCSAVSLLLRLHQDSPAVDASRGFRAFWGVGGCQPRVTSVAPTGDGRRPRKPRLLRGSPSDSDTGQEAELEFWLL